VNNTTTTAQIVSFVPTYFYMSVRYTDGLTGQAARDSYAGVALSVEYNNGVRTAPGPKPEQKMVFFSGDFSQDYADAITFAQALADGRDVPFMASSTLDDYCFDAEIVDDAEAGPDAEPVPTEAESAASAARAAAIFADLMAGRPAPEAVARFTAVTDRALEIDRKLEAAWDKVPAAKLRWALANIIAASNDDTSSQILDELLADEAWGVAMRPGR
jgi:hypothetical protein